MRVLPQDVILVLLPGVVGYGSQFLCGIGENAGDSVLFRPPAWVFGMVWPILFLLFGISWAVAARACGNQVLCMGSYALLTLSLGAWILVYGCGKSKAGASWILPVSLAAGFACFAQGDEVSKVLLAPLLAWLLFALLMNTTEVQNQPR